MAIVGTKQAGSLSVPASSGQQQQLKTSHRGEKVSIVLGEAGDSRPDPEDWGHGADQDQWGKRVGGDDHGRGEGSGPNPGHQREECNREPQPCYSAEGARERQRLEQAV